MDLLTEADTRNLSAVGIDVLDLAAMRAMGAFVHDHNSVFYQHVAAVNPRLAQVWKAGVEDVYQAMGQLQRLMDTMAAGPADALSVEAADYVRQLALPHLDTLLVVLVDGQVRLGKPNYPSHKRTALERVHTTLEVTRFGVKAVVTEMPPGLARASVEKLLALLTELQSGLSDPRISRPSTLADASPAP